MQNADIFHPADFKGLTPQEIIKMIEQDDSEIQFTKVYNRDEWIVNQSKYMDFFSVDGSGDQLILKIRKEPNWTVDQALHWLKGFQIQIEGSVKKVGPRNWKASTSTDFLDSITFDLSKDSEQLKGNLFVLSLVYKKGGNEWDKVVFRDGNVIECEVVESGQGSIKYKLPGESVLMGASKNQIKHILYRSGRLEQGAQLPVINGPEDWQKVILTTNAADVEGLQRVREIKGRSGWGGSMGGNLGNAGAKRSLQKAAAKLRAPIVLLQDRTKGMSTVVTGVAYK